MKRLKRLKRLVSQAKIAVHGLRNSLLLAPMPTASTAQILGNTESFEPYTQNLYVRRVLSGEFVQVNRHLLKDLITRGLWNDETRMKLIAHNGSVQRMDLPQDLKDLYKTVWEIKQRRVLDMAADRGAYIDQSQSLNLSFYSALSCDVMRCHACSVLECTRDVGDFRDVRIRVLESGGPDQGPVGSVCCLVHLVSTQSLQG